MEAGVPRRPGDVAAGVPSREGTVDCHYRGFKAQASRVDGRPDARKCCHERKPAWCALRPVAADLPRLSGPCRPEPLATTEAAARRGGLRHPWLLRVSGWSRAAIAVPARPPGEPPQRQPHHPGKPSRHFRPLESPATPRCDDRLSSGHHRRLIRRTPVAVGAIRPIRLRQIHLTHRGQHRPRQVTLRQPVPQRRRHQERLVTVNSNEVLRHYRIIKNPSDRLFPTATAQGREDVNARQRPAVIPTVRSGQWLREELKGVAVTWLDRGEMPSVKGDHDLGADPLGESDHAGVGST
jgi:hypothetical protein